jgi:formylglycine-generating enzyme required for sulfatase activity
MGVYQLVLIEKAIARNDFDGARSNVTLGREMASVDRQRLDQLEAEIPVQEQALLHKALRDRATYATLKLAHMQALRSHIEAQPEWRAILTSEFTFDRAIEITRDTHTTEMLLYTHKATQLTFAFIPGGTFTMNRRYSQNDRFGPKRDVTISRPFLLCVTECTTRAWKHVNEGKPPAAVAADDDTPVSMVSWAAVTAWCKKAGLQLPTEAQWEYAAYGGDTDAYGDTTPRYTELDAWYADNSRAQINTVRKLQANGYGLYDIFGNVWELCTDWHGDYPKEAQTDPTGPKEGKGRAVRGGSWRDKSGTCTAVARGLIEPELTSDQVGFRPCRTLP